MYLHSRPLKFLGNRPRGSVYIVDFQLFTPGVTTVKNGSNQQKLVEFGRYVLTLQSPQRAWV